MRKGQRLVKKPAAPKLRISPEQRLLILDAWRRSGLPVADFSAIVGIPKKPFYLTGQVGGKSFSVHAEGERVILKRRGEERQEVDLVPPEDEPSAEPAWQETLPEPLCRNGSPVAQPSEPSGPWAEEPGSWPLDQILPELDEAFSNEAGRHAYAVRGSPDPRGLRAPLPNNEGVHVNCSRFGGLGRRYRAQKGPWHSGRRSGPSGPWWHPPQTQKSSLNRPARGPAPLYFLYGS